MFTAILLTHRHSRSVHNISNQTFIKDSLHHDAKPRPTLHTFAKQI